MSWKHLGGLNPKFNEFLEKYPQATVLGVAWALYWRMALIILALEAVLFALFFAAGFAFGGFDHHRGGDRGATMPVSTQSKLDINVVCQSALAYTTFPDATSSEAFVADCKAGKHPEVIERYRADLQLGDGAAI